MFSKGCLASQQFVQRGSQRIDVRANVDMMRIRPLLRCHVIQSAHDLPGRCEFCSRLVVIDDRLFKHPCKTEVQHFDDGLRLPISSDDFRQHEIGRLDVAMHKALFVSILQSTGDLTNGKTCVGDIQAAVFSQYRCQVLAFDEFHGQIVLAIVITGIKRLHDVWMIELPKDRHFAIESCNGTLVTNHTRRQNFQRHRPLHSLVDCLIDSPHSSLSNFFNNSEVTQSLEDCLLIRRSRGICVDDRTCLRSSGCKLIDKSSHSPLAGAFFSIGHADHRRSSTGQHRFDRHLQLRDRLLAVRAVVQMVQNIRRDFFGQFTSNKGGELIVVGTGLLDHRTGFQNRLRIPRATDCFKRC